MTMSAFILACLTLAGVSGQTESSRSFSEHFVEANGVRLHYLDWGGQGEPVVFLTGFGTPAATFNDLAVGLRDRFHVYALTRRGFPPSQTPASGYELATLVADIMAFLDAKELQRVHLVGHSLAGLELTQIASRWPRRVRSLVYLDAIADPATAHAVLQKDPLRHLTSNWRRLDANQSLVERILRRFLWRKGAHAGDQCDSRSDTLASRRMRPSRSVSEPRPTGGRPPFPHRSDGWPHFDGKCRTRE